MASYYTSETDPGRTRRYRRYPRGLVFGPSGQLYLDNICYQYCCLREELSSITLEYLVMIYVLNLVVGWLISLDI